MIAGLLIRPVIPTLLFALPHLWVGDAIAGKQLKLAALVVYPTFLLLGYPSYLVLRRWGWTGMWALLSGLLVRNLGMLATMIALPRSAIGAMLAIGVFWGIVRPDRA